MDTKKNGCIGEFQECLWWERRSFGELRNSLAWERRSPAAHVYALETELAWMQMLSGMGYALLRDAGSSTYYYPHRAMRQGSHQPSHVDEHSPSTVRAVVAVGKDRELVEKRMVRQKLM